MEKTWIVTKMDEGSHMPNEKLQVKQENELRINQGQTKMEKHAIPRNSGELACLHGMRKA